MASRSSHTSIIWLSYARWTGDAANERFKSQQQQLFQQRWLSKQWNTIGYVVVIETTTAALPGTASWIGLCIGQQCATAQCYHAGTAQGHRKDTTIQWFDVAGFRFGWVKRFCVMRVPFDDSRGYNIFRISIFRCRIDFHDWSSDWWTFPSVVRRRLHALVRETSATNRWGPAGVVVQTQPPIGVTKKCSKISGIANHCDHRRGWARTIIARPCCDTGQCSNATGQHRTLRRRSFC